MERPSLTASAIISFAEKLEDEASRFYEELADAYAQGRETFLAFAKEAKRSKELVSRTYRETVSDAFETGFSFEALNLADYMLEKAPDEGLSYADALKAAIRLEEKAVRFYSDIAARSQSLLATIPRAFRKVAETRNSRVKRLKAFLASLGAS